MKPWSSPISFAACGKSGCGKDGDDNGRTFRDAANRGLLIEDDHVKLRAAVHRCNGAFDGLLLRRCFQFNLLGQHSAHAVFAEVHLDDLAHHDAGKRLRARRAAGAIEVFKPGIAVNGDGEGFSRSSIRESELVCSDGGDLAVQVVHTFHFVVVIFPVMRGQARDGYPRD